MPDEDHTERKQEQSGAIAGIRPTTQNPLVVSRLSGCGAVWNELWLCLPVYLSWSCLVLFPRPEALPRNFQGLVIIIPYQTEHLNPKPAESGHAPQEIIWDW